MVESGDWLTPFYNYELRFQKPILYYWMAAGRVQAHRGLRGRRTSAGGGLGPGPRPADLALRPASVPAAASALVAGLVAATNFGYFSMARMALPDLPLASASACRVGPRHRVGAGGSRGDPIAGPSSGCSSPVLAAALGVLMKGPVAIALPASSSARCFSRRGGSGAGRGSLRTSLAAAVLFVAIAAPWYVAMAREHGIGYLHHFFVGENLDRFATDRYNEPRPFWFYVPIIVRRAAAVVAVHGPVGEVGNPHRHGGPRSRHARMALVLLGGGPASSSTPSRSASSRGTCCPCCRRWPSCWPRASNAACSAPKRETRAAGVRWRGARRPPRASCGWCSAPLLQRGKPLLFAMDPTTGVDRHGPDHRRRARPAGASAGRRARVDSPGRRHRVGASLLARALLHLFRRRASSRCRRWPRPSSTTGPARTTSGTYRVFVRNFVFYTGVKQTDLNTLDELAEFRREPDRVLAVATQEDLRQARGASRAAAHGASSRSPTSTPRACACARCSIPTPTRTSRRSGW